MNTNKEIKEAVKDRYGKIANGDPSIQDPITSCCCGTDGCSDVTVEMALDYSDADRAAIPDGADLGLGCGTPAAFAELREGMTVLDLGSGAGIDCFVASRYVGASGRVIGVDMTEAMIGKANRNREKVNAANVEFRLGEIEHLPVDAGSVDRVISNCVINLVPDKRAAFSEIKRVLKPGGMFIVSDIVIDGTVTEEERLDASLWAGCISGAMDRNEYLGIIRGAGFGDVRVTSEKQYSYKLKSGAGLFSITVTGTK